MKMAFSGSYPRTSVIKSHSKRRVRAEDAQKVSATVFMLRSPFDAMLSELNLQLTGGHTSTASQAAVDKHLPTKMIHAAQAWMNQCRDFAGLRYWEQPGWIHPQPDQQVTTYIRHGVLFPSSTGTNHSIPILTLFYEDMVQNFEETSHRLFGFLQERLGEQTIGRFAHNCALLYHFRETNMKSKTKTERLKHVQRNPFTEPSGEIVKQGLVAQVCEIVEDCWYEPKWGKCMDGFLQKERNIPIKPVSRVANPCSV